MSAPPPRSPVKTAASWLLSLGSAAGLLWLASRRLELWPDTLVLAQPAALALACALHVPYVAVRSVRMACVLDPLVQEASAGAQTRFDRRVLYGSGLVSFFMVLLLPFRLGEFWRPVLLTRAAEPGVGMPEALSATAIERVVDGLLICALLFGGLAVSSPVGAESLSSVRDGGRVMAALFGTGCVGLLVAARHPERWGRWGGRLARPMGTRWEARVRALVVRVTEAVAAVVSLRRGGALVGWSMLYWGITVAQLWWVLQASGLALGWGEAAAVVAIIGLAIQLPGGPAQAGSFQLGGVVALGVFIPDAGGPAGASFLAWMYLLALGGGAIATAPGWWLLARARRTRRAAEPASREAH